MNHGFVRVAAATPLVSVADCFANIGHIERIMRSAEHQKVEMITFPELSITAYTCMDLFANNTLLQSAVDALLQLVDNTKDLDIFAVVGVPLTTENRLINAAVAFQKGKILGVVPKSYLANSHEYQERRWFSSAFDLREKNILIKGKTYPLSSHIIFTDLQHGVAAGIEICEDLWTPVPPSSLLAMEGANIIFNLSASNELIGKHQYRRSLVAQQSARCIAGYVYAAAGYGESSTDLVFAGGNMIAENGVILEEAQRFLMTGCFIMTEIDTQNLRTDRQVSSSFMQCAKSMLPAETIRIPFSLTSNPSPILTRYINPTPFRLYREALDERCEEVFNIQTAALARRIAHTGAETAVIGISGGLDSTLALLVTAMTFDLLKIPRKKIIGVTMPGFGTTKRTRDNAVQLIISIGADLREIPIEKACRQHFKDIGHKPKLHDVTFENIQARERTQILMDISNQTKGFVVGTGDLSEMALGWTTFNGDHISMYGINAGIPKTLVQHLVKWIATNKVDDEARTTLLDIVDTPISPELMPADSKGKIAQQTEDIIGPYILNDFFLYRLLRFGESPEKILFVAQKAFLGMYNIDTIKRWLPVFMKRFFAQQYKRNCLPDGPKVGSVGISPRGDWRMSSDVSPNLWTKG